MSTKKVLDEVRTFIIGSHKPVTFGQVLIHVNHKLPVGTYRPAEVKLAAYRMIDNGEATITRAWTIAPTQKQSGAKASKATKADALSAA